MGRKLGDKKAHFKMQFILMQYIFTGMLFNRKFQMIKFGMLFYDQKHRSIW